MKKQTFTSIALLMCLWMAMPARAQWSLVWQDEFENSISDSWTFEEGVGNYGWGNNEQQYYRANNASVVNGMLQIQARAESYGGASYTSARLKTQGIKSFKYGKIEARISMPSFAGVWPAFWMLGENITSVGWPACGEIDIMEHVNTENTTYGTCHWYSDAYASYSGNTWASVTDFHVYSIEWDEEYIRWFVDDTKYHEIYIADGTGGTEEFHNNFFIILNMAIGGEWPGYNIDNSAMPANMLVDYVRVYKDSDSDSSDNTETGVSGLGGTYYLQNRKSGLVMDVYYGGTDDGVNILQYTNGGTTNQQFNLVEVSSGVYYMTNVNSGKAVDVAGCSTENNANIQQWTYTGASCQQFKAISTGNGYYKFKALNSGKIIEVVNGSTEENENISQYTDNNQTCGQWALVSVNGTTSWSTTIEAEDYIDMSGVEIETCNEGGENVGYIDTGDWMSYNEITFPSSGTYTVTYRVSSESTGGQLSLDLNAGSIVLGSANIPVTGGWQTWTTVSQTITVDAGTYNLGIYATSGGWNLNWITISGQVLKSTNTAIDETDEISNSISVYPNPATNVIYLSGIEQECDVEIYNIQGTALQYVHLENGNEGIDVSSLKSGIYLLEVSYNNTTKTMRFLK